MAAVSISPVFNGTQFFDQLGRPLAGGLLYQYEASSFSTQQTTYSTVDGDVPNANPMVLDAAGRMGTDLWLENGLLYNLVVKNSTGVILEQVDEVSGVQAASASQGGATAIWNPVDSAPTFLSSTSVLVEGNYVTEFNPGNRVRVTFPNDTFKYGTVTSATFASPNTTINMVVDGSDSLNSQLSGVAWSALVTNGRTVDAAGVHYNPSLINTNPQTVGNKLNVLTGEIDALEAVVATLPVVYDAAANPFVITIPTTLTGYTTSQVFAVRFLAAASFSPTLNVNNLGAKAVMQYNTLGNKVAANISAGMTSAVLYDGTDFILQNPLPGAQTARSQYSYSQNGGEGATYDVFLTPGAWQLAIHGCAIFEPVSNVSFVVQQTASIQGLTSATWYGLCHRTGDRGHGYAPGFGMHASSTFNVTDAGVYSIVVSVMTNGENRPSGLITPAKFTPPNRYVYYTGSQVTLSAM